MSSEQDAAGMEGWAWGVDVGLSRVAIGVRSAHDSNYASRRTDGLGTDLPSKLVELHATVLGLASSMRELYTPAAIAVEMPFGKFRLTEFGAAFGVTIVALEQALRGCHHPPPIWSVPVTEWKMATAGKGNASKDDVAAWVSEQVGIDSPTHDISDALAIASFARGKLTEALA